ncbi:MAG: MATE family efflux transporter [Bacteroidota bacterium]|nr:MATE family efflux transporter [Bacteroidota bacterium]MDX5431445.1 MATE family efflux transporter [Bacteroidota bacterium]MDX5470173.1 MATE family efflux transporter [Bacteroidota bacterium]
MTLSEFWQVYRSHFKATLLLAWPIIVGQVGQVLMGVVDTAMVGKIGEASVAAAGASSAVFFLITVFGFGLSSAISPLVSMAAAKNDLAETAGILRGAYRASLIVSISIQVILYFISFQFGFLKQDQEVTDLAVAYLRIISWSVLPMILFLSAKQFADGLSFTRSSMFITLAAIPLNGFLNWLMIYGNWGFPAMNLDGAGYATLITRIVMMISMLLYVHQSKDLQHFVLQKPKLVTTFTKKVMAMGIPSGFQYFFEVAAFGGAMIMAGWIGVVEQAAHQIAINTAALTYMAVTGFAAAGGIRVGAAFGGYSQKELRVAGKSALLLGACWMILCGSLLALFRHEVVALYIDKPEVQAWAARLLLIAALFQLSDGIQAIGLGILRGIADVKWPMAITLFAYWVIGLPIGYYLGFNTALSVEGIWIGLLIGLSVSAALLYWRFNRLSKLKSE